MSRAFWEISNLRKKQGTTLVFPKLARSKLSLAAYLGDETAVVSLVAQGADLNANDEWLGPPLNATVYGGHLPIVQFLLSHKADINFRVYQGSPLTIAAHKKNKRMVQLLLENDEIDPGRTQKDPAKNALYVACRSGDIDIVRLLLSHKCVRLSPRRTLWYSPLEGALVGGHETIAHLLLRRQ